MGTLHRVLLLVGLTLICSEARAQYTPVYNAATCPPYDVMPDGVCTGCKATYDTDPVGCTVWVSCVDSNGGLHHSCTTYGEVERERCPCAASSTDKIQVYSPNWPHTLEINEVTCNDNDCTQLSSTFNWTIFVERCRIADC